MIRHRTNNWTNGLRTGCLTLVEDIRIILRHPPYYWLRLFSSQTFSRVDTPTILKFSHSTPTCLWRWNRQSVSKRRHIKFRRRGITQKKKHTTYRTWRKFEIKIIWSLLLIWLFRLSHSFMLFWFHFFGMTVYMDVCFVCFCLTL